MSRYASRQEWRKLYSTKAWHKLRTVQLAKEPLCARCQAMGRTVAATVADHIKPHKGDVQLFHDAANLQSLCKHCHDSWKHRIEIGAVERKEFGADGYPIEARE